MATQSADGVQHFKREQTVGHSGLITPSQSMSATGTSPKLESIDRASLEVSDITQGASPFPISNHGLAMDNETQDEGYVTQVPDNKVRSMSRMIPTPHRHFYFFLLS
jgi:hypothetical protein